MAKRLSGKNAVVTGAGRGIGREIALALAVEGANVVVNDLGVKVDGTTPSGGPAEEVVEEVKRLAVKAVFNPEDVSNFHGAERLINTCVENLGSIDILCNIAGILRDRMVFNMSEQEWDSVLAVHLKGTFNCIRHATPFMRKQRWGRIINVTAPAWKGTIGQCNYGAAKGGIASLTFSIALEMGRYGVTCNAISPFAATRMTLSPETIAGIEARLKAGLITQAEFDNFKNLPGPEYIPPIVVYLAGEKAYNINGRVFGCGGGKVSLYSHPEEIKQIYKKEKWTVEELEEMVPGFLLKE